MTHLINTDRFMRTFDVFIRVSEDARPAPDQRAGEQGNGFSLRNLREGFCIAGELEHSV